MNQLRWWVGGLVALAALAAVTTDLRAEEAKLQYNADSAVLDAGAVLIPRSRELKALPTPPRPLKNPPKLASANPRYFELKLGPQQAAYTLILDESGGTGQGYDRLYLDASASGDLAEAKPVSGQAGKDRAQTNCLFKDCQVAVDYGGGQKAPWRFDAFAYTFTPPGGQPETALVVCPFGYYGGTLALDGKQVKVAVVDADCTGRYNDPLDLRKVSLSGEGPVLLPGSRVLFDLNGDGRFDVAGSESFACTKFVQLDGGFYAMTVAPSGQSLTLARGDAPQSTLERDGGGRFTLSLLSAECGLVTVQSDGNAAKLPAGTYKLLSCTVAVTGKDGALWQAGGKGTAKGSEFEVKAGAPTRLKVGPPLLLGVTIATRPGTKAEALRPGDEVSLGIEVFGQAGETYNSSVLRQGSAAAQPPSVRITAEDGKLVQAGSFRYG